MINEMYQLSKSLKKCGIQLCDLHQNIKKLGKAEGFIIGIDSNSNPSTVEHVNAEKMSSLWTLRKGNHNSFPCIKIKPIIEIPIEDSVRYEIENKKKKCEEKKELLRQAIRKYELNEAGLNLTDWAFDQIKEVEGKDKKLSALTELIKRWPKNKEFLKKLYLILLENSNDQNFDLIKSILIGKVKEDKGVKKVICDIPLFFDIGDWSNHPCRVASPEMPSILSLYLPDESDSKKMAGMSAFGGNNIHVTPYPDPNLPIIGKTYLFSMNKDIPCHNRYKKIGSYIFPASPDEVKIMHAAINWCTAEERKGKTWQSVPNTKGKLDLVISYLEEKPDIAIELANIFAAPDVEENDTNVSIYESKAQIVCKALKGETGLNDSSRINLLVLGKVDKGRAQVVLNSSYCIKNIIERSEEWSKAAKNHPLFYCILPGKKDKKAIMAEPSCPSPSDVMKIFQSQWIRGGFVKNNIPGVGLSQIYDLFLGNTLIMRQTASDLLNLFIQRLKPLFIGIAGVDHQNKIKEYSFEARRDILIGISVLAILLYKLGIKKEVYMKNAPFNVGRMLSLADKLHEQYCKIVRKSDPPAQLIGNALMHTAMDNPVKGLAMLGERLLIYQAWATKVQGDDVKLTKWVLGQIGQVSLELENATIPTNTDDIAKAQILLGYLAHSKKEE